MIERGELRLTELHPGIPHRQLWAANRPSHAWRRQEPRRRVPEVGFRTWVMVGGPHRGSHPHRAKCAPRATVVRNVRMCPKPAGFGRCRCPPNPKTL
jgi:hypothetical protein